MTVTDNNTRATYLKRYEENDNGLRFQDLTYTGNFTHLDPVVDGILGERTMRGRTVTNVLEKVSHEDVLRDQFSLDEINDYTNYLAWNIWDVLVMRATEGESGMIPRQQYEILGMLHSFYRYPELLQMVTDEVGGAQGVIDLGASTRSQIGTKLNPLHDWCIGACGFGMGRTGLLALGAIDVDDYVTESNTILKFMQRVKWGKRQDGYIFNAQDRYRNRVHDQDLVDRLATQVEHFEPDSDKHAAFVQFNAAAELLSFLDHYDCRLGVQDAGPYELADGKILILRDLFVNEPVWRWSAVCEQAGLPHAYTLAMVLDPEVLALEEIRINDIGTTFTRPKNYLEAVTGAAVFSRAEWDTPMDQVESIAIDDLGSHLENIQTATFGMYETLSKTPRRELIWDGQFVYYLGFILPHLRAAGVYEKAVRDYDLWEVDQRVANQYYEINKRGFAAETMPNKIFSGAGYLPFPAGTDLRRSKYRQL
jgi:hypothetical protein